MGARAVPSTAAQQMAAEQIALSTDLWKICNMIGADVEGPKLR